MKSLSPNIAKLIKSMGYRDLCMSENTMADRAHFIKIFNAQKSRGAYNNNLKSLTNQVKGIGDGKEIK